MRTAPTACHPSPQQNMKDVLVFSVLYTLTRVGNYTTAGEKAAMGRKWEKRVRSG